MKKVILVLLLFSFGITILAQSSHEKMMQRHNLMMRKHGKELRMLEQLKLIEYLSLDENTAVRFSARRNNFLAKQDSLLMRKKVLTDSLSKLIEQKRSASEYKTVVNRIFNVDKAMITNRENYLKNLSDFLSQEQIAKIVVFENRFKKDIMKMMFRRRNGMNPKDIPSSEE